MPDWTVSPHQRGLTSLEWLRTRLPAAPKAYLRQLLRKNRVLRNGTALAESDELIPGDHLRLPDSRRLSDLLHQGDAAPVSILWEDDLAMLVDKPAGLAVHRSQGHEGDNLLQRVERLLALRGEKARAAPVHRLDRDTSGAILFAKSRDAASLFGKMFMTGAAEKTYLALACGDIRGAGRLQSPVPAKGKIKEAATGYIVLAAHGGLSLVELSLETGRTHQIRRQLAEAGHPLAGDRRYGGPGLRDGRFYLHCRRLGFTHPATGIRRIVIAPLPEDFATVLQKNKLPYALP